MVLGMGALARVDNGNPFCDNTYYISDKRMKNKNRPRRGKPKTREKPEKPFNSWVVKYFDMTGGKNGTGTDIERKAHK